MANTFNCPSCSAPLEITGQETTIHCEYCGATVIVPPELRTPASAPAVSAPVSEPHPSQVEGPHGQLTSSQMRQMMTYIRAGQVEDAIKTFQEGTGSNPDLASQTVQMISSQIATSNVILPATLAAIMRAYAESANQNRQGSTPITQTRRQGSGLGCWLVLAIILLVFYFAYTSISPVSLATELIAGNTGAPVVQTAIAPIHSIATAIAPLLH